MRIERFVCGPLETNTYLLWDADAGRAVLIDPAAVAPKIAARVSELGVSVTWALLTHGHFDHIGGADWARDAFGCRLAVGEGDAKRLLDPSLNLSGDAAGWGIPPVRVRPAEATVSSGPFELWPGTSVFAIATPGHTPGSTCYLTGKDLFTGDTLFAGTVGRTDLPGGDAQTLTRSLSALIKAAPAGAAIHPGHGAATTMEEEMSANPFLHGC